MHGIETLEEKCIRQGAELDAANAKIALLEAKLDHLIRRLFGSKSEKIDPAQLELLFKDMPGKPEAFPAEEIASDAAEQQPAGKKRAAHRSRSAAVARDHSAPRAVAVFALR